MKTKITVTCPIMLCVNRYLLGIITSKNRHKIASADVNKTELTAQGALLDARINTWEKSDNYKTFQGRHL